MTRHPNPQTPVVPALGRTLRDTTRNDSACTPVDRRGPARPPGERMNEPTIHDIERSEISRRWTLALVLSIAITLVLATWIGLFGFLGANASYATFNRFVERWLPETETEATLLDLPDLSRVSRIWTEDGILLAELHAGRISEPARMSEIPDALIYAVLAAEDGDYFEHEGIDFAAIISAIRDYVTGASRRGGSTITQQIVKKNIVGDELTIRRKILEALYAIELEQRYTKRQILEFYMNSVYFGWSAYGVRAAAREYFGEDKDLADLSIAEAATIAVTIRNPSLYDPRRQEERGPRSAGRCNRCHGHLRVHHLRGGGGSQGGTVPDRAAVSVREPGRPCGCRGSPPDSQRSRVRRLPGRHQGGA